MASKWHEGKCGPCALCNKYSPKYKHFGTMDSDTKRVIASVSDIEDKNCICYRCCLYVARTKDSDSFRPSWRKGSEQRNCCVQGCKKPWRSNTTTTELETLEEILQEKVISMHVDGAITSIGLCKDHYNKMYSKVHAYEPDICASCNTRSRRGEKFNRHCPEPDVINNYINCISSEQLQLTADSILCYPCYKYFIQITKNKSSQKQVDTIESCIRNLEGTIASLEVCDTDDYLELTMCKVTKQLAEELKKNEAVLLSTVYRDYTSELKSNISTHPKAHLTDDLPSRRWVLSRLHTHFGDAIEVHCRHKRYGSIIFARGCDLVHAVSSVLGKLHHQHISEPGEAVQVPTVNSECMEEKVNIVANHLNKLIHDQSKQLIDTYKDKPDMYPMFNLEALRNQLNPCLLKFIETLTQTVRSVRCKRSLFSNSEPTRTKMVRQIFIACMIIFNTNSVCSMPLHVLLTEAILCNGGSQELVRLLNRVGAVASLDTVNRLNTQVAVKRRTQGIISELKPDAFTIVSVDNIDILQPHAAVSSTDATRSWHGISEQCVQPRPSFNVLGSEERLPTRKHPVSSPIHSPLPQQRHKRRRRTFTELPSPHTNVALPIQPIRDIVSLDGVGYQALDNANLSIDDFHINIKEKSCLDQFKVSIFKAILLKRTKSSSSKLPGLPSLICALQPRITDTEKSNVTYIEIRSEPADSKDTLCRVIASLHKIFVVKFGQKWLVVVGDAKVYTIMQAIKAEYGDHLGWLIPWPGDWHILLNYQKTLMKAYNDAGLSKLGAISGHRAETLTSLVNCSNFKRTHNFLIQAFQAFYNYFISLYLARANTRQTSLIETSLQKVIELFQSLSSDGQISTFRIEANDILDKLPCTYSEFKQYMDDLGKKQHTIKFWYTFISDHYLAYLALFDSIRSRNWHLRIGSLKMMSPFLSALDRPTYQCLIPSHLKTIATLPPPLIEHFEDGGFSVRLSNTDWHAVGLDECHEMMINKDAKMAVIRPSEEKMDFISNSIQFRSACLRNLQHQLFSEDETEPEFSHKPTSRDEISDCNVKAMTTAIVDHGMFVGSPDNTGLWNFLDSIKATPEQEQDL